MLPSRAGRHREVHPKGISAYGPSPLKVKGVIVDKNRYLACLKEKQARQDEADRQTIIDSLNEKRKSNPKSLAGIRVTGSVSSLRRDNVSINKERSKCLGINYVSIQIVVTNMTQATHGLNLGTDKQAAPILSELPALFPGFGSLLDSEGNLIVLAAVGTSSSVRVAELLMTTLLANLRKPRDDRGWKSLFAGFNGEWGQILKYQLFSTPLMILLTFYYEY